MQRLNRGMMSRYEIHDRIPGTVNAIQFGMDATLLGLVDRLIDDVGLGAGIACIQAEEEGFAALMREQDGLFTVVVRGYINDKHVYQEKVVQSVVQTIDPASDFDSLTVLSRNEALALGILNLESLHPEIALGLAARFLAARYQAGLDGLEFICTGESVDCGAQARAMIEKIAVPWHINEGFEAWLREKNAFYPALADCLVFRCEAAEAAKLCGDMNYADGLIHIAEPYASLTIQAPSGFRERWKLDAAPGVRFVDDLAPELLKKHRIFDAGLFAMAAPGYLLGCDTLNDCMRHERLRAHTGSTFFEEIIPGAPFAREEIAPYVIAVCERFENPLNHNPILRSSHHLFRRFVRGVLPLMREWARENFEVPRRMGFSLAAAIMLYAGVRPNQAGIYEVARGAQTHILEDDPEILRAFARLSHDMPPESLAYAVLADRDLWNGLDLRQIDGMESRVTFDIAAIQRNPTFLPEGD